jgi:16S rRNA (guanine966-N2)-methyltransferase
LTPPGSVRVIGGKWRRALIPVPDVPGVRPSPDRVRETLFNWLTPGIAGCTCLDLFAGTGVLGIEAASRGAARVVSVDHDPIVVRALRALATRLGARELSVVRADALAFLAGAAMPCDLVFLDPPFSERLWQPCCAGLQNGGWLKLGARVYLEAPRGRPLPLPAGWRVHRAGHAGHLQFCLAPPQSL